MVPIWILTLPAFRWVYVYPTTDRELDSSIRQTHGHKVHEKQMVAYRGDICFNLPAIVIKELWFTSLSQAPHIMPYKAGMV